MPVPQPMNATLSVYSARLAGPDEVGGVYPRGCPPPGVTHSPPLVQMDLLAQQNISIFPPGPPVAELFEMPDGVEWVVTELLVEGQPQGCYADPIDIFETPDCTAVPQWWLN